MDVNMFLFPLHCSLLSNYFHCLSFFYFCSPSSRLLSAFLSSISIVSPFVYSAFLEFPCFFHLPHSHPLNSLPSHPQLCIYSSFVSFHHPTTVSVSHFSLPQSSFATPSLSFSPLRNDSSFANLFLPCCTPPLALPLCLISFSLSASQPFFPRPFPSRSP